MKSFKSTRFNIIKSVLIGVSIAFFLTSCSKWDNDDYGGNIPDAAYVEIIHGAAGQSSFDIALDNNRLGVNFFNYTGRITYFRAYPGTRNFKVYQSIAASTTPIFSKDLSFEVGKYYSIFIVDTASKMDAVSLRDSSRAAGQDSVRLRFANMSPDAPALDLYVKGASAPIVTGITYKTAGNFVSFPATSNAVFEVKQSGQATLLATLDPMNLIRGNIYTIWSGGYLSGNEAAGLRIRLNSFSH